MMTVLKLRHQLVRNSIHVNVWAGEKEPGLYWAGRLVLKPKDWDAFRRQLEIDSFEKSSVYFRDVIVEQGP
jgi:hypothetical protein